MSMRDNTFPNITKVTKILFFVYYFNLFNKYFPKSNYS